MPADPYSTPEMPGAEEPAAPAPEEGAASEEEDPMKALEQAAEEAAPKN